MSSTFQAGSEKSTACLAEKQLWFTQSAHLESNLIQHWQPGCILFGGRCGKPPALPLAMLRRGVRISGNPGPFQVPRWCRWCLVIQNLLHEQVAKLQGEALEGDHSYSPAGRSSQDPQRTSTKQSRSPMFPCKSNYQLVDDYIYTYIHIIIYLSIYLI